MNGLSEAQRAVLRCIDDDEVVDLTRSLVRIPSITGEEGRGISDFMCNWLTETGLEAGIQRVETPVPEGILKLTKRDLADLQESRCERYNVYAQMKGGHAPSPSQPPRRLLFQGHMDTKWVDGMEIEPFSGEVRGGRLYGRGAADMKSGLAAMMMAMKALRISQVPWTGICRFGSEVGEEGGGWGLSTLGQLGFLDADAAVVAEPSELQVQIGNRGGYRAEIRVRGRAIHSGLAQQGVNAIEKMSPVVDGLYSMLHTWESDPVWGKTSVNVQKIEGGGRIEASVADECTAWVDFRVTPQQPPDTVRSQMMAMLREIAERDRDFLYEVVEYIPGSPAVGISPEEKLVGQARHAVELVRGSSRMSACPGGTAAGHLIRQHGTPSIVLGPGSLAQAHGRNEWVETKEVTDAARIYALIALEVLA